MPKPTSVSQNGEPEHFVWESQSGTLSGNDTSSDISSRYKDKKVAPPSEKPPAETNDGVLSPRDDGIIGPGESTPLPSIGSAGHDSGECKPCAFVHHSMCVAAEKCTFCHFNHKRNYHRPSKKKRERFQELIALQKNSVESI